MDGPWQIGQKTATEYGRLAAETAKGDAAHRPERGTRGLRQLRRGDAHVRLLGGRRPRPGVRRRRLHLPAQPTTNPLPGDRVGYLASAHAMDRFIDGVAATSTTSARRDAPRRKLRLSFDEWNVWFMSRFAGQDNLDWAEAPRLIEDEYNRRGRRRSSATC